MNLSLRTANKYTGDKNRQIVASFIILLMLISWSGFLDYFSYVYLEESMLNALSSFGLSRALNGIISVLQSTTLSVGIASVSIGELLDPVNDIIERFSQLLTLSIASIIVQKVLLSIISSTFFKVLFTLSGFTLLVSLSIRNSPFIPILTRSFILLVFFRLALSLMILLNSVVDYAFLANQINANYENVTIETNKLDSLKDEIMIQKERINKLENKIIVSKNKKHKLIERLDIQLNTMYQQQIIIKEMQTEVDLLISKLSPFEKYNFLREDVILDAAENKLATMKGRLAMTEELVEATRNEIKNIDELISDYENDVSGQSGGLINGIKEMTGFIKNNNMSSLNDKLLVIKQQLDLIVTNLLDLMTLYAMKTILFPIFFMYLLTKSFKLIWALELPDFLKVSK